jgi:Cft2 family RNA processing exonuclease
MQHRPAPIRQKARTNGLALRAWRFGYRQWLCPPTAGLHGLSYPGLAAIAIAEWNRSVRIEFSPRGIYLVELDLWLDSTEDGHTTWVSHGHSDHAGGSHARLIGTPPTLEFFRMRQTLLAGGGCAPPQCTALDYGESLQFRGARLTAIPAAHILGAAQLLIEYGGERVVYTGDIKLCRPLLGAATVCVPCHRLIIESTFGLPIYRFLDPEAARDRMLRFARECLDDGLSPAYLGYPLGRGQEIVHTLTNAGIPTAVHGAIARLIPAFERAGYSFPGWQPYEARATAGKAIVVTPGFKNVLEAAGRFRVAYVSGWAALDNARARAGAEELIPYSDHGDFEELIAMVESSGAREVDVVHGYTEPFAHILRQRGWEARCPRATSGRGGAEEPEG